MYLVKMHLSTLSLFTNRIGSIVKYILLGCICLTNTIHIQANHVLRKLDIPDLSNNAVLYIHRDRTGNMWFGTYDGLNLYNGKNTFVFRYDPGDEHSIDGNIIRKIIDGGPDHIWVSTIIGLNRISISERKVVKSYPQYPETCLLASDSLGHALFILSNHALSYFSPEKEIFHDIHVPGLALTDVKELFFDKDNFYFLTGNGFLRQIELTIHDASISWKFHEISLHTSEINHAFYDKEERKLFFTDITSKLYVYDNKTQQKELVVDLSFLNDRYADISRILLWESNIYISYVNNGLIKLNRKNNTSTISFVAIDYIGGNNYEYAYLLDNYDKSWVALQKNNEVSFSNLPFGRYILRIKYKNDVFNNVIKECQLPIYIQPPWYLTYWAIVGYIILYILLLVSIIKFFQKHFDKRQQLLHQRMEDEQKEKLNEAKLNFFTSITHELRTPLTLINGIVENIHSFKVTESEALYEENVEILRNNVKELNELIQEMFLLTIEKDRIHSRTAQPAPLLETEKTVKEESGKPLILVIDNNRDIVWLIKNTLFTEYEIKEAFSASDAFHFLEKHIPVLIITDILMPDINGLDFIRQIRAVKLTRHIPIIIVSAKISAEEQAEGLNSGADLYLTKPFSAIVLHSAVNRLISTKRDLKEYYYSPESAFELYDGQLLHQEDKDFMELVTKVIGENLDRENFRPEMIAEKTRMNTRSFYRKFKRITSLSPTDFIKDYRFIYAAKLLITTNLSVQEIIYKIGINNKSYFYREFLKKYQMTPKEYRRREKTI